MFESESIALIVYNYETEDKLKGLFMSVQWLHSVLYSLETDKDVTTLAGYAVEVTN